MAADKSFGLTFLYVSGATDVHLSYLKRFGGSQVGKFNFADGILWGATLPGNHIKEGYCINTQ